MARVGPSVFQRAESIESNRQSLTRALAAGELSFEALLDEQLADAVTAFNRLDKRSRAQIAAGMRKRSASDPSVRLARTDGPRQLELLHATRTDEAIFLLVRTPDVKLPSAVPVTLTWARSRSSGGRWSRPPYHDRFIDLRSARSARSAALWAFSS